MAKILQLHHFFLIAPCPVYFSIDEDKVDEQFDELTNDLTDEQKTALTKKYGRMEALIKLDKRMRAVAQDIVEHFRTHIEPNGFKAQIVCYDREACAIYKKILTL